MALVFEISAVNLMEGWCEFACVMNLSISGLLTSHNEKMLSMYCFQTIGSAFGKDLCLKISHKDFFSLADLINIHGHS